MFSVSPAVMIITLIAQGFLEKIEFFKELKYIGYIDEIIALYAMAFVLRNFNEVISNQSLRLYTFIYLAYVFAGILSSVFGDVYFMQALLQGVLDLKFYIVTTYCALLFGRAGGKIFENTLIVLVFLNIPFIAWQLLSSTSYDYVFSAGAHTGLMYTDSGDELNRAAGIYWHPGILGAMSALTLGHFFFKTTMIKKAPAKLYIAVILISIFELFSTLSRGEIGACLIALLLVYLYIIKSVLVKFVVGGSAILFFILYVSIYPKMVYKSLAEVGFSELTWETTPRALLMHSALDIADERLPLGAGLGSFGGLSADIFDSDLYYKYNLSREWWFGERLFLKDTYWPKIVAESGYLGVVLLLLFIFFPVFAARRTRADFYKVYSLYAILVLFIISFSSPVYNAPLYVFTASFYLGSLLSTREYRD
jgi:hypothetical protein